MEHNMITKTKHSCVNIEKFLNIIPRKLDSQYKINESDFKRNRKMSLPRLITFILSIVASGGNKGVDIKAGVFFRNARRSGLWIAAKAIHRSSLTKRRKKVPWQIFQDMLHKSVEVAYEIFPKKSEYLWHSLSVFAIDGSKYDLPATEEIRNKFDPESGLQYSGRGHYPQCLVSTSYDVFRRLPIGRTIVGIDGSEREEVKNLLPCIPSPCKSIVLFDRGYPSYELLIYILNNFKGYFVFRSPSSSTFASVETFIKSGKLEDEIWLTPSNNYVRKLSDEERKGLNSIKLRVIKLVSPDGTVSVLLTNLFDRKEYAREEIETLYFRRYKIEEHYRDEKVTMEVEKFHSKQINGILQELFAAAIMTVITRTLMVMSSERFGGDKEYEYQFKNAINTLALESAFLVPDYAEKAIEIFKEILSEISRVKYYTPQKIRPSQARVNKRPPNKWCFNKSKKLE
jgi:hypothetical protein